MEIYNLTLELSQKPCITFNYNEWYNPIMRLMLLCKINDELQIHVMQVTLHVNKLQVMLPFCWLYYKQCKNIHVKNLLMVILKFIFKSIAAPHIPSTEISTYHDTINEVDVIIQF